MRDRPTLTYAQVPLHGTVIMIETLLVLLAIGFVIYYLVRHPIKSFKFTFSIVGLLILGVVGICLFLLLFLGVLTAIG